MATEIYSFSPRQRIDLTSFHQERKQSKQEALDNEEEMMQYLN